MSQERQDALSRLKTTLTRDQITDLILVIQTAEVQGNYFFDGNGSVWSDDVNTTLMQLASEFNPEKEEDNA